jgi:hypothetical protein
MEPPNPNVDVRINIITIDEMYSDFIRFPPLTVWHGLDGLVNQDTLAISFGKQGNTGSVPVQEVPMADRPDFALCKKPRDRNRSQAFRCRCRIMILPPEESPTTAATAEHEGAERRMPMADSVGFQQRIQIFRG